ncbi:peptide MFS transporter [Zunongwangia sp. HGR-M22]|uniref:peptide MFS transporter n=1 Tax=Zunongwangia sp. HGR-M22 TaxID=3015168 RepID=UPI0022DE55AA|nr:peptide MFS transporter [Zunongwangia sp. HGR-M22]WBL26090.1 peptide MFS transporter [Zunongwangia sp. HGR-M22]
MANRSDLERKEIFGHPVGLYILFFTEMWERFSYYGMRALLTLFLVASVTSDNPGWGWSNDEAINLYKWYTTLVYIASIPGGIIADRFLGQKKTVMIGGILLCVGHLVLAYESIEAFYIGLAFIIAGVGGLKPNISTMVGGLYPKSENDRRDQGFYIFYIGINLGAFLAGIIIGQVGEKINWHYGFGLAGIGMLIGQLVYIFGQRYLKGVGEFSGKSENEEEREAMKRPLTRVEKDRMIVMGISFLIIIVFWGAFEQAGGLMNIYAQQNTDRVIFGWEVPASYFQSVNAFFIFTLALAVAGFWTWWKRRGKESSSLFKMAVGVIVMGFGFTFMSFASLQYEEFGKSAMYWLVLAYLFHTLGELCASPVALSFITKLAPVKYASFMMGAYFAATGLGNFVAGTVGEQIKNASEFQIFTGIFIFCLIFGLLIILLLKPLKRLTHGAEDSQMEDGIPKETAIE